MFSDRRQALSHQIKAFKVALALFYCAYYPRIFSSMFCGEITTNRCQLYRFRVFKNGRLENKSGQGKIGKTWQQGEQFFQKYHIL